MMSIVHYVHYEKNWYYWIDESEHSCYDPARNVKDGMQWFAGEDTANMAAKKILKEKFPEDKIVKHIAYHDGVRGKSKGMKNGSRPYKTKYNWNAERKFKKKQQNTQ